MVGIFKKGPVQPKHPTSFLCFRKQLFMTPNIHITVSLGYMRFNLMTVFQILMKTNSVEHQIHHPLESRRKIAVRVRWFNGSLVFYFLWHFFTSKIDSAGTSLVEDTCQCLEAKYLMMSKLIKAKENSVEILLLLIAWKILYLQYVTEPVNDS